MSFIPALAFAEIAKGNKAAEEFMGRFYLWVHKQDDLIDKDKPVCADVSVSFDLSMFEAFAKNEFFQKHYDSLWPIIVTSALAYIASEDRRQSADVVERITAQVLKSQYMDVFFAVAVWVGGFGHALAMSRKYREYDFNVEPAAPVVEYRVMGHV